MSKALILISPSMDNQFLLGYDPSSHNILNKSHGVIVLLLKRRPFAVVFIHTRTVNNISPGLHKLLFIFYFRKIRRGLYEYILLNMPCTKLIIAMRKYMSNCIKQSKISIYYYNP